MKIIIGVSFRQAGKVYYFDPTGYTLKRGQRVIVETAKGVEIGTVVVPNREMAEEKIVAPLKKIMRIATPADEEAEKKNQEKEKEAFQICLEKIKKHNLEMKLIDAEYTFDNNKLLFYFTADGRIDFRELVKDLASIFRTRIELRQIGVRDETKICGGIGICGRPLCCHTHLFDFAPVSIKMAKEQNLSLNPSKISGVCGRLMCCLKNEEEAYEKLNENLPNVGSRVDTPEGLSGEVKYVSVLKQMVKVIVELDDEEKEIREYHVDELKFKRRGPIEIIKDRVSEEEEKELQSLLASEEADKKLVSIDDEDQPAKEETKQKKFKNKNKNSNNFKNKEKSNTGNNNIKGNKNLNKKPKNDNRHNGNFNRKSFKNTNSKPKGNVKNNGES